MRNLNILRYGGVNFNVEGDHILPIIADNGSLGLLVYLLPSNSDQHALRENPAALTTLLSAIDYKYLVTAVRAIGTIE